MKISELAKKAKMSPKMLLIQVIKSGISAKSVQSSLSGAELDKALKMLAKKKPSLDIESIRKAAAAKGKAGPKAAKKEPAKKAKPAAKKPKKAAAKRRFCSILNPLDIQSAIPYLF